MSDHHHSHHHHSHHHHQHSHQCLNHGKMQDSDKKWQQNHPNYASTDSGPQTFFYTLTNMLKLNQAKNILEIGCGAGKLLSTVLDLKNPDATYYATDLSEGMVKEAKKRLEAHFAKYESKLTFEEWLQKQHLIFQAQNGQNIKIKENILFDRIISNMVLCHANDPQKMLKNWHSIAANDCLLGISFLGDPQKNRLVREAREAIQQTGQKLPQGNPPYYWYDKISKIAESSGWEILLQWDQNSLFPFLTIEQFGLKNMIQKQVPEGSAREKYMTLVQKIMNEQKSGIQFWSKVIIAKKKN